MFKAVLTTFREEDFEANQAELQFLRIQLQAIEAQCAQYIPPGEDQDLSQSIKNWKIDWEDIDRRSRARRKKCHLARDGAQSVVDGAFEEGLQLQPMMET
jgi:hypothetical protein